MKPPRVLVHAPGKVVVLGEYAVLDGAPAIVAAIDRGVRCAVSTAPTLAVTTPGDNRFARAALEQLAAPPGHYAFSAWNPVDALVGAEKPGFGGSAAAVTAACLAAGFQGSAHELFDCAQRIHHAVQGSGSGIDVAASVYGGVIEFESGRVRAAASPEFCLVWSGHSAQTGPRVAAYLSLRERDTIAARSRELVHRFPAEPIDVLREARRWLHRELRAAGIEWETPALGQIADLAEQYGGAAKPSGAGGGDCAIAIFPDPDGEFEFLNACERLGFCPIPAKVSTGATRTSPESGEFQ
jgi:phosphomevalonate kinase